MNKKQAGFSVVELLLVVVVVALLAGLGYLFYQRRHNPTKSSTATATTVQPQAAVPTAGTTANIDSLTAQDASGEASVDQKHTSSESTAAQSANAAAANVGGAYNESSL